MFRLRKDCSVMTLRGKHLLIRGTGKALEVNGSFARIWDMASGVVKSRDALLIVVMICAFVANYYLKVNVIYIILVTAAIGAVRTIIREKGGKKA